MGDAPQTEIARVLSRIQSGETDRRAATGHIFEAAYGELRRLASHLMRAERFDHTLSPTALVHEAYVKLAGTPDVSWQGQAHFSVKASVGRGVRPWGPRACARVDTHNRAAT